MRNEAGAGSARSGRLALHRTGGQTGNDVLLQVLEKQDHRNCSNDRARREDTPRGIQFTRPPVVHTNRQRELIGGLHNNRGNDEVTEARDEAQQANNCQNR